MFLIMNDCFRAVFIALASQSREGQDWLFYNEKVFESNFVRKS